MAPRQLGSLLLVLNVLAATNALAQGVVTGRNQTVGPGIDRFEDRADYLIRADLGVQAPGSPNLIHTFREFNLRAGELVSFEGPDSVANIIALVNGGGRSSMTARFAPRFLAAISTC